MIVHIPTPLRSYTDAAEVEAGGSTLAEVLRHLDRRYPGIRFRIVDELGAVRRHIKLYVNSTATDDLDRSVGDGDAVHIICALSGG